MGNIIRMCHIVVTSHCEFTVQLGIHLFISPATADFVNCLSHHGDSQHKTLKDKEGGGDNNKSDE